MPTERELKLKLSAAEAEKLADILGPPVETIEQLNYYLDTADGALRSHRQMVRLREESIVRSPIHSLPEIRFVLTLKGGSQTDGLISVRNEQEMTVEAVAAKNILATGLLLEDAPLENLRQVGIDLGVPTIYNQGLLKNRRQMFDLNVLIPLASKTPSEIQMALDRSIYPDKSVDFEAEIELPSSLTAFPEGFVRRLALLFSGAGINWAPGNTSKFRRWLERR